MKSPETPMQKLRRKWPWVVGAVVVVGGVGGWAFTRTVSEALAKDAPATFRVQRGPLTISVVQPGTIKSMEQVSLKCEVEGQATIIFLIPEGTQVNKGDLLVELDASKLQDELLQQEIAVHNADAAFVRARENLAVTRNQAASNISRAELDYQFAQEDVKQYEEGLYPQEVKEAESKITLAREELERAAEKLKWSERLYEEKYISQTELEADRLTYNRAQLNHELAVATLELLRTYTSQRKLAELKSNVDQTNMALERVKLQANADIVQAEAELKAKETELRQQRSMMERVQRQIERTKIYAPRSGLVVYATSMQTGGRRMRSEPLEEGQAVRERQELIYLPSAESMMAEVLIHESSLEKVRIGLPVRVTVDALPGQVFTGRVAKIAPLPDAQSAWMNPDLKVYPTEIHLSATDSSLRTGMSCQAEIIVQQHADAVYVPVQAVLRRGGSPTVYVRAGGGFEPRPVRIGLDNNSMVHVLEGLTAGQEVLLTPPLSAGTATEPTSSAGTGDLAPGGPAAGATPAAPGADVRPGAAAAGSGPPGEPGQRGPQEMSAEERAKMRERFQNMTPEEREKMRERFRNMTPEEREQLMRQRGALGGERAPGGERGGEGRGSAGGGPGGEDREPGRGGGGGA